MALRDWETRERAELVNRNPQAFIKGIRAAGTGLAATIIAEGAVPQQFEFSMGEGSLSGGEGVGDFCYTQECDGGLKWRDKGTKLYSGATVQQDPGAFLFKGRLKLPGGTTQYWDVVLWDEPPCAFSGLSEPGVGRVQHNVYSGAYCWIGESVPDEIVYPYITLGELLEQVHPVPTTAEPPVDYYLPSVQPPELERAEESIRDDVNADQRTQERNKHDRQPELFPDPAIPKTQTEEDHSCDRSPGPLYENPTGNAEPFARKKATPFFVDDRPPGAEGEEAIYLHWGTAKWWPVLEGWPGERRNVDEWTGFGYRHIAAKHGWGAEDLLETEAALATASAARSGSAWTYELPLGDGCTRKVVVKYTGNEADPEAPGIITSFNYG